MLKTTASLTDDLDHELTTGMPLQNTQTLHTTAAISGLSSEFAEEAFRLHKTRRVSAASDTSVLEVIAEEVPVTLIYNEMPHATFLTTPVDLADFARGFSLTDGIVQHLDEIADISVFNGADGIEVRLYIAPLRFGALQDHRHKLLNSGKHGLSGVRRVIRPVISASLFTEAAVHEAYTQLPKLQLLNLALGSLQATGITRASGEIVAVREDIRRHNAFDKAAGAALKLGNPFRDCFAILTGNCSFDMVEKAAFIGLPMIVGLAAPSSLAIKTAEDLGVTICSFSRSERLSVYCHAERIVGVNF